MPGMGIGEQLRQERLRQGLTLDDIVRRTRISPRSLEAIEANAFDRLPGIVFTRSFVRLYAVELKLDTEGLLERLPKLDLETVPLPNPPASKSYRSWDPRLTAALASVLWVVTAVGAGTGAWYYFNHFSHRGISVIASAPAPKPAGIPKVSQAAPIAINEAQPIKPESAPDNNRPVQVILTAREAAWVQISTDGRTAFVGTLHPHDTRAIAADDQVKIITGNAGGLDISLNGKPLDPIGPSGQVRTVKLTADGPQFVQKTPPASSPL